MPGTHPPGETIGATWKSPAGSKHVQADLEAVLAAWHSATLRLEQTHNALSAEVRRLTAELERKNRQLARKDRLADLGQMASHIAHEVRNCLVPVSLYASLLKRRLAGDHGSLEILAEMAAGIASLDVTVNDLLQFTLDRDPQWESVPVRKLVEEVLASIAPQLDAQAIDPRVVIAPQIAIMGDRNMVHRALLNLVLNAVDAMPHGGTLTITARENAARLDVEVADTGAGLSDEALRRAFEPFYTTKRNGTGLGLAIVYRVAEVHGGDVTAVNRPNGGAALTIHFPSPSAQATAPTCLPQATSEPTIHV
jgi:signal transduction histidine kinase